VKASSGRRLKIRRLKMKLPKEDSGNVHLHLKTLQGSLSFHKLARARCREGSGAQGEVLRREEGAVIVKEEASRDSSPRSRIESKCHKREERQDVLKDLWKKSFNAVLPVKGSDDSGGNGSSPRRWSCHRQCCEGTSSVAVYSGSDWPETRLPRRC
jgi:hypothetical protein